MRNILRNVRLNVLACLIALPAIALQAQLPTTAPGGSIAGKSVSNAAPTPSNPGVIYLYPLEAKLVHSFDSTSLAIGDHVLTRLSHVWTDGECTLPAGTALSGQVTGIHEWTRQDKQTRVTLLFHYICHEDQRPLHLISLLAPENPDLLGIHGNPVAMQALRSSFNGEGDPFRASGKEQGSNHYDLSGHQNPQLPLFINAEPNPDHRPTEVKRGMVWHLPGIGLNSSDSTPSTSSLVSTHRAIKLPNETVLVMQSEQTSAPLAVGTPLAHVGNIPTATVPHSQLAPLAPEITACPPTTCSALATVASSPKTPTAEFSLRRYSHLHNQAGEIAGLDYNTVVAFLGKEEVLVCIGKPGLVERTGKERPEDHPHLVQAILFDRQTGRVNRTAEWLVPNRDRYLWPLANGRILVHHGDRLVWYGPGLTQEHTMPLHAPLAFIHTSGDGQHLLIGTLRELHSKDEHAELYKNDSRAPEEEVRETVYDSQLTPLSESVRSSRSLPPLLWNTGRITLRHRSNTVWYYRETRWDGEQRTFGALTSSCVPQTSALSGDMLLVIGCETHSLNAWARILRADGSIVLHALVRPSDLYPVASDTAPGTVVLISPRLNPASNRDGVLHSSDIIGESVRVLRTTNGYQQFSTEIQKPTTSAQAAAVDPEGTALAVLDGDAVRLYALPAATISTASEHDGK